MAHKHNSKNKPQRNDDAGSIAQHLLPTPVGYTAPTQEVQAAKRNNCERHSANIKASHSTTAPIGHPASTWKVQAEKRNNRVEQDGGINPLHPLSIHASIDHVTPTGNVQTDIHTGNDAKTTDLHLLSTPIGYASSEGNVRAEKRNAHDGKDANNIAASQLPSSPAKHNCPENETQNKRWVDDEGKQGNTPRTLPTRKREESAVGYDPQDGQQNTGSVMHPICQG